MPEQLPPGVRPPMALPHARGDERTFGQVPYAVGAQRRRRVTGRTPETATLQWSLPAEQMTLWHDWFEDTLEAGARSFAVQLQGRYASRSLQTVIARFASPPRTVIRSAWAVITADIVIDQPATIVTSQPYPLDAIDGLGLGLAILRMSFGTLRAPPESLNVAMTLQGATLSDGLASIDMSDEAMTIALSLAGGTLAVPGSDTINMTDEALDLGITLQGGALADLLIQYGNYVDEALDLGIVVQSGTLQ